MPSVYTIILDNYPDSWGKRGSAGMSELERYLASSELWRRNARWKFKSYTTSTLHRLPLLYTGSTHANKIKRRQQLWDSKLLSVHGSRAEETIHSIKVRKRLLAKVSSRGRKGSCRYYRGLESRSDNTLFVKADLEDQSQLQAAIWLEQTRNGWKIQAVSRVDITVLDGHPALQPFFNDHQRLSMDHGLRGLRFPVLPQYVESTIAQVAGEDTVPTLIGNHYYLEFAFGQNLQAAVRRRMPLALICENPESGHWRSTPFDLVFAEVSLFNCVLQISTQFVEEVYHSTCYLIGLGPDNRAYYTQLGDDDGSLRWNLYLDKPLRYQPPSGFTDDASVVPDLEDRFYLDNERGYPDLGDLADYDRWMGGDAWRTGAVTGEVYKSLKSAQLLHLQLGINLTTLRVTDTALTFRGTPTTTNTDPRFAYERSLFRVAAGQPFNPGLLRIHHESQLRMKALGYSCEGYLEVAEDGTFVNLRPTSDFFINAFAKQLGVNLPLNFTNPVDQFMLRLNVATSAWRMYATNDVDFQLDPPLEGK